MPEVVAITNQSVPMIDRTIATDLRPANGREYLAVGRVSGSDILLDHGTVSKHHANLVYNVEAQNGFEARTWYFQPVTDNVNGTFLNGTRVAKDQWVALPREGSRLMAGGVPLVATYGTGDGLRLVTDTQALVAMGKLPPPPPSQPAAIPPMPQIPKLKDSPVPPPLPAGIVPSAVPPAPPSKRGARVSPALAEAMRRDENADDGMPRSGAVSVAPPLPPTLQNGELNLFGAALVHLVSRRGTVGERKPIADVPNGHEIILENAGLFSMGATQYAAVYRMNGAVYVARTGDSQVTLTRPDRPKETLVVERGKDNAKDAPDGSVIRIGDKHTVRIRYANGS